MPGPGENSVRETTAMRLAGSRGGNGTSGAASSPKHCKAALAPQPAPLDPVQYEPTDVLRAMPPISAPVDDQLLQSLATVPSARYTRPSTSAPDHEPPTDGARVSVRLRGLSISPASNPARLRARGTPSVRTQPPGFWRNWTGVMSSERSVVGPSAPSHATQREPCRPAAAARVAHS